MKAHIQTPLLMVSEIEVSYQPKFKASERPKVSSSKDAYNILFQNWDQGKIELKEQFFILLLNRANRVLGMTEISSGGMSATVVDPKLVFGVALKCCASSLILCHNHPSGSLTASHEDILLTNKLVQAGKLLDLKILDHIILSKEGYLSFADQGLL